MSEGVIREMERNVGFLDGFINKKKSKCVLFILKNGIFIQQINH